MMKKSLILLLFLLVPISSAEIYFSQPDSAYSFGDNLELRGTLGSGISQADFLIVRFYCGQSNVEIYRSPFSFSQPGEKNFDISLALTEDLLGNMSGNCFLRGNFGAQQGDSSEFLVTRSLIVESSVDKTIYKPSEQVKLSGVARTPNGRGAEGSVEIRLGDLYLASPVTNGKFSMNFTVPQNAAPGEQDIDIFVYEKDSFGQVTNSFRADKPIMVSEMINHIDIETDGQITPGSEFEIGVSVFNQVQNKISRDVSIKIFDSSGREVKSKTIHSGSVEHYSVPDNAVPGRWRIEAETEGVRDEFELLILENEKAEFRMENDTLVVRNVGNVDYNEVVEIAFGNTTLFKEVNIPIGGERRFKLSAPDSVYDVSVRESKGEYSFGSIPLTGRAVDIGEVGSYSSQIFLPLLIIIFIVALFFGVHYYNGRRSKHDYSVREVKSVPRTVALTSAKFSDGEKEDAAILAVIVNNRSNEASSLISEIKSQIGMGKGYVKDDGNLILGIYTKRLAGEDVNSKALRAGWAISQKIIDHNRLERHKFRVGVGVGDGQLITGYSAGKFSYASVQNSIGRAKNLAASSNGELLLSDSFYRKIVSEVSASKKGNGWHVTRVKDHDSHGAFVDNFLKRNQFKK